MIHPPASWSCFQHISVSLDRSGPRYMRSHSLPTFGQLSHLSEKLAEREDVENGKICVTRIDHILSQQRSRWYQYKHSGRWFSSVAPSCAAETHARANPIRTCQGHAKRMLVEKWLVEVIMATMDCWVSPTFRKLEVRQKKTHYYPDDFPKSICCTPTKCCGFGPTIGPVLVRTCEFHPQNRHHHGPPGPRRFGWDIMGYHGNVMGMLWECYGSSKWSRSRANLVNRRFVAFFGWSIKLSLDGPPKLEVLKCPCPAMIWGSEGVEYVPNGNWTGETHDNSLDFAGFPYFPTIFRYRTPGSTQFLTGHG